MHYAIRKKGTDTFLTEGARYGSLDDAFLYEDLDDARGEVYTDDEIVLLSLTVVRVVESEPVEDAE